MVLGLGFGILLSTRGFGTLWSLGMAAFIYAGSMQYVALDLLSEGTPLLTAALTTLMVNARHLFYGISMVEKYRDAGRLKPYLIFALTDETYSLLCEDDGSLAPRDRTLYCVLVSLLDHLYWITGCTLGGALGNVLRFNTKGLDFALTALFLTIVTEQWHSTGDHLPAITGLGGTALCLLLFGSESFLVPSMALIAVILTLLRRREEAAHD